MIINAFVTAPSFKTLIFVSPLKQPSTVLCLRSSWPGTGDMWEQQQEQTFTSLTSTFLPALLLHGNVGRWYFSNKLCGRDQLSYLMFLNHKLWIRKKCFTWHFRASWAFLEFRVPVEKHLVMSPAGFLQGYTVARGNKIWIKSLDVEK